MKLFLNDTSFKLIHSLMLTFRVLRLPFFLLLLYSNFLLLPLPPFCVPGNLLALVLQGVNMSK